MLRKNCIFLLLLHALATLTALEGTYAIQTANSNGLAVAMNRYLPPGYGSSVNATKKYPLWVYLPGAGEHGDPNNRNVVLDKSTRWGPSREIRYSDRDYPFIVVTPVGQEFWTKKPHEINVMVEFLKAHYRINADRICVAGLCTGAGGVMEYTQVYHYQIASIFPVITQSSPWRPSRLVEIPSWLFHSYGDPVVSRTHTITWANAIANASVPTPSCMNNYPFGRTYSGGQTFNSVDQTGSFRPASGWQWVSGVKAPSDSLLHFTMYTSNAHEVWQKTINNPTVLHWAFKQRRQAPYAGTPAVLPGIVQAERFDFGGHLRAYLDRTIANTGLNIFRKVANPYDGVGDDEQVDLASGGSGVVLTGTQSGEWIEYATTCARSGTFPLRLRVSAPTGGSVRFTANGIAITGAITIPATTGYTTVTFPGVTLSAGQKLLRLNILQGGFNLDWFQIGL